MKTFKKNITYLIIAIALVGIAASIVSAAGSGTVTPLPIRNFLGLTDAPHSYVGQAGKVVTVNSGETGLQFSAGGGGTTQTYAAGTGLTLSGNSFSVNTSQNISILSNLTSNGLVKTSGGAGTLGIATAGTDYLSSVNVNTSLTGAGTTASALGVNLAHTNSYSAIQNFNAGALVAGGDLSVDATGGTTSTPRVLGLINLNPSTAARFQFGDQFNSIQTEFGGRLQLRSYWGMEIYGNANGASVNFVTGTSSDPALNVYGTMAANPVLAVTEATSQSANVQEWRNSSNAVLAAITSSGAITSTTLTNGLVKSTSGLLSNATAGTDYQAPITLTTTGTSGAATFTAGTLNIPQYSGGGTSYLAGTGLTLTTNTFSVNTSQNISTLSNLTSNGLVVTTGGTGALSIATTTLPSAIVSSSLTSLGTIATGVWNGTLISPTFGGTGVNNGSKTITLGGNLTTSGAFTTQFTSVANTSVTLPTTGTLAVAMNQTFGTTQGRWQMAGCSNGAVATNSTAVANTMYAEPFQVTRAATAISISSDVEATGGTGSTAELGIYADNGNGLPGSLVIDAGAITTVGLGTHALTISQALPAGQYFAVILYSAAPSIKGLPTNGTWPCMGVAGTIGVGTPNNGAEVTASQTFGALPGTFSTTPSYPTSPPYPIILVQMQ